MSDVLGFRCFIGGSDAQREALTSDMVCSAIAVSLGIDRGLLEGKISKPARPDTLLFTGIVKQVHSQEEFDYVDLNLKQSVNTKNLSANIEEKLDLYDESQNISVASLIVSPFGTPAPDLSEPTEERTLRFLVSGSDAALESIDEDVIASALRDCLEISKERFKVRVGSSERKSTVLVSCTVSGVATLDSWERIAGALRTAARGTKLNQSISEALTSVMSSDADLEISASNLMIDGSSADEDRSSLHPGRKMMRSGTVVYTPGDSEDPEPDYMDGTAEEEFEMVEQPSVESVSPKEDAESTLASAADSDTSSPAEIIDAEVEDDDLKVREEQKGQNDNNPLKRRPSVVDDLLETQVTPEPELSAEPVIPLTRDADFDMIPSPDKLDTPSDDAAEEDSDEKEESAAGDDDAAADGTDVPRRKSLEMYVDTGDSSPAKTTLADLDERGRDLISVKRELYETESKMALIKQDYAMEKQAMVERMEALRRKLDKQKHESMEVEFELDMERKEREKMSEQAHKDFMIKLEEERHRHEAVLSQMNEEHAKKLNSVEKRLRRASEVHELTVAQLKEESTSKVQTLTHELSRLKGEMAAKGAKDRMVDDLKKDLEAVKDEMNSLRVDYEERIVRMTAESSAELEEAHAQSQNDLLRIRSELRSMRNERDSLLRENKQLKKEVSDLGESRKFLEHKVHSLEIEIQKERKQRHRDFLEHTPPPEGSPGTQVPSQIDSKMSSVSYEPTRDESPVPMTEDQMTVQQPPSHSVGTHERKRSYHSRGKSMITVTTDEKGASVMIVQKTSAAMADAAHEVGADVEDTGDFDSSPFASSSGTGTGTVSTASSRSTKSTLHPTAAVGSTATTVRFSTDLAEEIRSDRDALRVQLNESRQKHNKEISQLMDENSRLKSAAELAKESYLQDKQRVQYALGRKEEQLDRANRKNKELEAALARKDKDFGKEKSILNRELDIKTAELAQLQDMVKTLETHVDELRYYGSEDDDDTVDKTMSPLVGPDGSMFAVSAQEIDQSDYHLSTALPIVEDMSGSAADLTVSSLEDYRGQTIPVSPGDADATEEYSVEALMYRGSPTQEELVAAEDFEALNSVFEEVAKENEDLKAELTGKRRTIVELENIVDEMRKKEEEFLELKSKADQLKSEESALINTMIAESTGARTPDERAHSPAAQAIENELTSMRREQARLASELTRVNDELKRSDDGLREVVAQREKLKEEIDVSKTKMESLKREVSVNEGKISELAAERDRAIHDKLRMIASFNEQMELMRGFMMRSKKH